MQIQAAKVFLAILMFTLAVPESEARRLGSGRSVGRQSQLKRQRFAPPPASVRPQPVPPLARPSPRPLGQPNLAQRRATPIYPRGAIPGQAGSSPFRGMLSGVLIGLGLGSILSSGHAQPPVSHEADIQETVRQEVARQEMEKKEAAGKASTVEEAASSEAATESAGESAIGTTASGSGEPAEHASPASGNW
jgi:hypothetical protein